MNNTTMFINQTLNDTITNCSLFVIPEPRYMEFSDITNVSSGIKFYVACISVYPYIFIPVAVLAFIVGYYSIKKVIKYE